MVQGIGAAVDGVLFVGYRDRARRRDPGSHLVHVSHCRSLPEQDGRQKIGLHAPCAAISAPVLMISGDQSACAEAANLLGPLETAVVKHATGRTAAECLPPHATQERIRAAARAGVQRLATGSAPPLLIITSPVTVAIEFKRSDQADGAMLAPGAVRISGRRVEITVSSAGGTRLSRWRLARSSVAVRRIDLTAGDEGLIEQAAELLVAGL
jgi:D-amino peptidase